MSESARSWAILFVDDEERSRKYFIRFFGKEREVLTAADGREGLELYREHRDRIGIVVTDQMMPAMSGLELLGKIEAEGSPAVRILSSAYADTADVEEATGSGLIDFLITKPWDLAALESLLEEAWACWQRRMSSAA